MLFDLWGRGREVACPSEGFLDLPPAPDDDGGRLGDSEFPGFPLVTDFDFLSGMPRLSSEVDLL